MRIILGYILTFGWVFLTLGAAQRIKTAKHTGDELTRKIVHISVAFAWIPMYLCFGARWHLVVPPAVFIVLNTISYRQGLFSGMERSDESKKSLGTVYYAVSMTVMAVWSVLAPECLVPYGTGLFCMALGDGLAPWFGAIKKGNVRLFGNRTLFGSLSVFVISLLVAAVMNAVFGMDLSFGRMLLLALGAVVFELVGVRGLDNLTLPLGVFLLTLLFTLK